MVSAPSTTTQTIPNRHSREACTAGEGTKSALTQPVRKIIIRKTGAECFAASARPSDNAHVPRSIHFQVQNAGIVSNTADAHKRETGRSVITTASGAPTAGS